MFGPWALGPNWLHWFGPGALGPHWLHWWLHWNEPWATLVTLARGLLAATLVALLRALRPGATLVALVQALDPGPHWLH